MSGPGGAEGPTDDKALVEAVLRELSEAADMWEALVAEAERITFTVDMGDIHAVANVDGKLVELTLHPKITEYSHDELAQRLNVAFAALRDEAVADNATRYGGGLR
ncbi:hypothetical protein AWB99_17175 [Mycolicibacterium confluentis]|uniref:Uncharacterized protein n=1 Tax=Mycolicibacterium confluentis TaxID=28047 RepID=A0A7I7Y4M6_9MYCO|nr:DUF2710 family protein [Mycolicibacterium confluentis]ORV28837.1 hypothetical protein AWB99_17175 [Mycolicibacterium confluentis]BBZ36615.1 hypothetical protein MCNF_52200 [Mycolicibacterium confluentis]